MAYSGAGHTKRQILVVDDETGILKAVTLILELEGYLVQQAANGLQALERMETAPPDLLITDYMMPRMDGIELLRTVRANPVFARLPVILMTAGVLPQPEADELADCTLSKPMTLDRLLSAVSTLLDAHSS